MSWLGNIKEKTRQVLGEHPASVIVYFISFLLMGILSFEYDLKYPSMLSNVLTFAEYFLLALTPAFLLCEANFLYRKSKGKIESLLQIDRSCIYIIVMAIGALCSCLFSLFRVKFFSNGLKEILGYNFDDAEEFFLRFFYVYLAICCISAVYFLCKKRALSFEGYCVRGFLGIMKGYLAYGIILIGTFCILWVFQTLIVEIDIYEFVMAIISGLMSYTMVLLALSRPGEKISRFGNIIMGYVFPGILVVAFVVVYAYILKIIFTWTFPSNQAFAIVTALFVSGLCFWTMAQGCTEGRYLKALKIFPLLFVPFIVIQIMCLYMRVHQYGLTVSRYMGILLIIFEIIYEVYYAVRCLKGKGLGAFLFPVLLAFTVVFFLVPGLNAYACATRSQKKAVEKVMAQIEDGLVPSSQDIARARSAYNEIRDNTGLEGKLFVQKLEKSHPREELDKYFEMAGDVENEDRYIYADASFHSIDISDYSLMGRVDVSYYREAVDVRHLKLTDENGDEVYAVVDISGLVSEMEKSYDRNGTSDELDELIKTPLIFADKSALYIEYINIEENSDKEITQLRLTGYYLYNQG